ncbi:hypothetical protein NHQ30_006359 [Ciborinia camelliae]|nr:hypothetical protein NHQ30_006359 [Ciborinia camelliae]
MTSTSVTTTPSSNYSSKGMSGVAKAMIILAVASFILTLAVSARLLWSRRARQQRSLIEGKFKNLDEEAGMAEKPVELQGNDSQIVKWGGIGVHKSYRVHTSERIPSYISPLSPKNKSYRTSSGEPRCLLTILEESLRGVTQSREPVGRIDTRNVRWPSTSTIYSPTSPDVAEPRGALFPPHRLYNNYSLSRESLPPKLEALNLPSLSLSLEFRPYTPHQPLPKTPTPAIPTKAISRLNEPFSDFPHQMPPPCRKVGASYGALSRSRSVNENASYPRAFPTSTSTPTPTPKPTPTRHSTPHPPRTPKRRTTITSTPPISPPLSPSAQSFRTFGDRYSTHSQASTYTFQTHSRSHSRTHSHTHPYLTQEIIDAPPLPSIPSIYPISQPNSRSNSISRSISRSKSKSKSKPPHATTTTTSTSIYQHRPTASEPPLPLPLPLTLPYTLAQKERFQHYHHHGKQPSISTSRPPSKTSTIHSPNILSETLLEREREGNGSGNGALLYAHGHGNDGHGHGDGDLGEMVTSWFEATRRA